MRTDTQTRSAHRGEHFVYREWLLILTTHGRSQTRVQEGDATGSRATLMRGEGRYRSSPRLYLFMHMWPFLHEDSLARLPTVTDGYGSSPKEFACSPTLKNEEAPGPRGAWERLLQDGRRRSRGETDLLVRKTRGGLG